MSEKLQKILAHAGLGSRREIETWISAGRISVNGKRAKLGDRAVASDRILLDGRLLEISAAKHQNLKALIYHKPEGEICSRTDPQGRPTIFANLPSIPGGRWVSVGRLDLNTSGLILLTNNGDLANKLMHPSTGLEREYLVRIRGRATPETIKTLTGKGVEIDGKKAKFESIVSADEGEMGTNHWYSVVIREGRYREVRRMWDAVGHTVSRLKRIRYGTIKLTRDLKQGQCVKMAPKQLEKLVSAVGLSDQFANQLYSAGRSSSAKRTAKVSSNRNRVRSSSTRVSSASQEHKPSKPRNSRRVNNKPVRKGGPKHG